MATAIEMEARQLRGQEIADVDGSIVAIDEATFRVASQTGHGDYLVHTTYQDAWACSCPDYLYRMLKCKHIWAVELSTRIKEAVRQNVVIEPVSITVCLSCGSPHLKKFGLRHAKAGAIQRFMCLDCKRTFSLNIGFENLKHSPQAVTTAMQLYFSGESLRNTAKSLKLLGMDVSYRTVLRWIQKYTRLMKNYLENITPQVSDTWRADEMFLKIKGDLKYMFAMIDDETRFWIAKEVADTKHTHDTRHFLRLSRELVGKKPRTFITDGLASYHNAYKKEWWTRSRETRTVHIRDIRLDGTIHNNKMERFNGEVRDRERVMRGLKTTNTPILDGYQVYHNYIRPHSALNGKTPAEMCGIQVKGDNKWMTIIQRAATQKSHERTQP